MSSILVFPGQGSQAVGMGKDLYDNNPDARAVFEEVDDALNQKLSDIIFNGPMEDLTLTTNVQPAIMAVSIAMLRASGIPLTEYVAGHSLGEYTALCAAGALSVGDTARLLRLRGDAMQRAVPVGAGLTAVILGLDIEQVREICAQLIVMLQMITVRVKLWFLVHVILWKKHWNWPRMPAQNAQCHWHCLCPYIAEFRRPLRMRCAPHWKKLK